MIEVEYLAPSPALAPFISVFYLFQSDEDGFEDIERADIAQYRFILKGAGELTFGDGHRQDIFAASLMGPRTKASRIKVTGPGRVFGLGLLPAGWAAFTRLPADKHINRSFDAVALFGERVTQTLASLKGMTALPEMAALIEERTADFAEGAKAVPLEFIAAVDRWLQTKLSPQVADLAAATNLSQRQIERLCCSLYGSPPKFLVRKYRALRAANAIAHGQGDWHDFLDEGFYDQPHCIRELKEFIGMTPAAVRQHASRLTSKTFDRSRLEGQIPALSAQT